MYIWEEREREKFPLLKHRRHPRHLNRRQRDLTFTEHLLSVRCVIYIGIFKVYASFHVFIHLISGHFIYFFTVGKLRLRVVM